MSQRSRAGLTTGQVLIPRHCPMCQPHSVPSRDSGGTHWPRNQGWNPHTYRCGRIRRQVYLITVVLCSKDQQEFTTPNSGPHVFWVRNIWVKIGNPVEAPLLVGAGVGFLSDHALQNNTSWRLSTSHENQHRHVILCALFLDHSVIRFH